MDAFAAAAMVAAICADPAWSAEPKLSAADNKITEAQHRLIEGEIQRIVREIKVFSKGEEAAPLELLKGPLLRFEVKPRYVYGTVWAWSGPGRPQAVFSLALCGPPDQPLWLEEIVSLSSKPVCASAGGRTWWAAETPGWSPKLIPCSDAPSTNPEKRLRQMKALSVRFTGWESSEAGEPWELERVAEPIYRYAGQTGSTLDGAIFVFAGRGNNPEILLVIEADEVAAGQAKWKFGAAPLGANRLIVKLDGKEAWTRAWVNDGRTKPSEVYYLRFVSAKEEMRRKEGRPKRSELPDRDPFAP